MLKPKKNIIKNIEVEPNPEISILIAEDQQKHIAYHTRMVRKV